MRPSGETKEALAAAKRDDGAHREASQIREDVGIPLEAERLEPVRQGGDLLRHPHPLIGSSGPGQRECNGKRERKTLHVLLHLRHSAHGTILGSDAGYVARRHRGRKAGRHQMQLASVRACPGGATIGKLDASPFCSTVSAGLAQDRPDGGGMRAGRRL